MSITPNTDNYTLGRGRLLFNRKNTDGSYQGMRDLGNAPDVALSVSVDKLDHFSSRTGLRVKDKSVIVGMTVSGKFTLDEANAENIAMILMASMTETVQSADDDKTKAIGATGVAEGLYYELDEKFCGVNRISHGTVSGGPFEVDETITGGTSSATAVVKRVDAAQLIIDTVSGTFVSGEVLTGGTSSATATTSSAVVFDEDDLVVYSTGPVYYTAGTDFTLEPKSGKMFVMDGTTIPATTALTIDFGVKAQTYKTLNAFDVSAVEGEMHFIGDAAVGNDQIIKIWDASIMPSGDIGLISDEWNNFEFELEVQKDESGHPLFPYMEVIVT